MAGLIGQTLGRYEIVERLGAGGMGEVYKARDTQLGRWVAIKVISSKVAQSRRAIDRFEREAKTVAQLSHPNILDIHDFGRDAGIVYAVTELLEGSDLRDRLRGSMLPLSKALEIGIAVANGLAAAHSKGIIHRDIKPDNIFVTSTGRVKILDFGIAGLKAGAMPKDVDPEARTESLTMTGDVLGTVGYMSPEQVRGEKVDQRSDIFALGCLLYEVLTGRRAFQGATSQETILSILNRDPEPIAGYRPDIPPGLDAIVSRCLEKQPDERFESARDVAFALQAMSGGRAVQHDEHRPDPPILRRMPVVASISAVSILVALLAWWGPWRVPPQLPEIKHLAVMDFTAVGDKPELIESAAGLTRAVASGLSLVEQESRGVFWVVPFRDAKHYRVQTIEGMHRTFGVTVALTGRLQRSGDLLRLDIEAIDSVSGKRLRGLEIEDNLSNLSSFQEGPVLRICEILGFSVTPATRERLASTATTAPEGLDSFLRGVGVFAAATDEGDLDRAIDFLEKATALDPLFTHGRVALGRAYLQKFEISEEPEWIARAEADAVRATKEGKWPEAAYDLLADVYRAKGQLPAAVAALESAARVAPSSADTHLNLAQGYQEMGRIDDSEGSIQSAIFLRPGYWPAIDRLAKLYLKQGRYEAAANQFEEVIACAPRLTRGYNNLGGVLTYLGRFEEAREMFELSIDMEPSRTALSNLGTLYFDDGRFADAADMFEQALQEDDSRFLTWGNLGYAYKFGPAPDKADDCFRRAVELGEELLNSEPGNLWIMTELAAYHAMLDQHDKGLSLLKQAVAGQPQGSQLIARIAETFEDLGERDHALDWVARSFRDGVPPSRFERRPTLRKLVADERYQQLVQERTDYS